MRKKLVNVEGNARGVSVAIKGFGALAAPAVHFRGPAHVAVMFNEALQQGQILFLRLGNNSSVKAALGTI